MALRGKKAARTAVGRADRMCGDDAAARSLAWFRIALGVVVALSVQRAVFSPGILSTGDRRLNTPWPWLPLMPWDNAPVALLRAAQTASLLAAANILPAASLVIAAGAWGLANATDFLHFWNHHLLEVILLVLLAVAHAQRPAHARRMLQMAVVTVYLHAGAIKAASPDWWRGEPLRLWFSRKSFVPESELVVMAGAIGALVLELVLPWFLLTRRWMWAHTVAKASFAAFHVCNLLLFRRIGTFPLLMLATCLLYADNLPAVPSPVAWRSSDRPRAPRAVAWVVVAACVALPLRGALVSPSFNEIFWNRYGFVGAWRMMSFDTECSLDYIYADGVWVDEATAMAVAPMPTYFHLATPDAFVTWAVAVAARVGGAEDAPVRAAVTCSLNGREPQLLISPAVPLPPHTTFAWPYEFVTELRPRVVGSPLVEKGDAMYETDRDAARLLYAEAAATGAPDGAYKLGLALLDGPSQRNPAKAQAWLADAADTMPEASFALGVLRGDGDLVRRAERWGLRLAAEAIFEAETGVRVPDHLQAHTV